MHEGGKRNTRAVGIADRASRAEIRDELDVFASSDMTASIPSTDEEVNVAKADVALTRTDSIHDEIDHLHDAISRRAYELFRDGGSGGGPLDDWLTAEHGLVWRPSLELRCKDGQFEVLAAVAGVEPKDLDVEVAPEDLLIKAEITHEHAADKGTVQLCEFSHGKVWRSLHFPEPIDPASARAEYQNGLLRVTAAVAQPGRKKVAETSADRRG